MDRLQLQRDVMRKASWRQVKVELCGSRTPEPCLSEVTEFTR